VRTTVTRSFSFEAAHQLPWHPGRCKRLHGHSYRLEVTVAGAVDHNGVVIDFDDVKRIVTTEVVDRFDHQLLNDLIENPTAELVAADAWKRLEAAGLPVVKLRLWETADSSVELLAE
jgi:6-pyruvoyltetrahydropterin/6-carboxytetrahydropterin synthase